jgi:hypothetical protein
MNFLTGFPLRALLFLAACFSVAQAHAADAYHEFVADVYQLQSYQTRNPGVVIAYADGKNGALLKSVLAPERFAPQLEYYFKTASRSQDKTLPNLMHAIKPVIDRYDVAFKADPKKFEAEYLDSLECGVMILTGSNKLLEQSSPQAVPTDGTSEQKKIAEAAEKMRENVKNMSAAVTRNLAQSLRQRVEKGEFSPEGSKRVLALANKLVPK